MKVTVPQTGLELWEGMQVRVTSNSLDEFSGGQHPQAGRVGVITEFVGVRFKAEGIRPRALIKLPDASVAVVGIEYLEIASKRKTA